MRDPPPGKKVQVVFAVRIAEDHRARPLAINPSAPETTFEDPGVAKVAAGGQACWCTTTLLP